MNCFYHPEVSIVATCQDCGKGLCVDCASRYTIPICKQCNSNRKSIDLKLIRKDFIHVFVIGALITFFIHYFYFNFIIESKTELTSNPKIFCFYILVIVVNYYYSIGIIVGWKTLTRLTPQMFLFLPLIGWLIYFMIKIYISMFVGLVWTPVWVIRKIRRL